MSVKRKRNAARSQKLAEYIVLNGKCYLSDWDNPQYSCRFKLIYSLRTKIERLFSRMEVRFKMKHLYKHGIDKIKGHILKFMNLMYILANLTGTYGVWDLKRRSAMVHKWKNRLKEKCVHTEKKSKKS